MKIINFSCVYENELGNPVPAKSMIPQWYKDGETYYYSKECGSEECHGNCPSEKSAGLKTCMAMLDTFTTGYYLVTPFDIYVGKNDDGTLKITWNGPPEWGSFVNQRPEESGSTIPRPKGHHRSHLIWSVPWGWTTPKGYSSLVTHPLNGFDLPFTTMSGIIDSDKIAVNGNVPFFIKEDFYGMIPAGTPYIHIIPMKRNKWSKIENKVNKYKYKATGSKVHSEKKYYLKNIWEKKEFS